MVFMSKTLVIVESSQYESRASYGTSLQRPDLTEENMSL
jgi:hypothetical protein